MMKAFLIPSEEEPQKQNKNKSKNNIITPICNLHWIFWTLPIKNPTTPNHQINNWTKQKRDNNNSKTHNKQGKKIPMFRSRGEEGGWLLRKQKLGGMKPGPTAPTRIWASDEFLVDGIEEIFFFLSCWWPRARQHSPQRKSFLFFSSLLCLETLSLSISPKILGFVEGKRRGDVMMKRMMGYKRRKKVGRERGRDEKAGERRSKDKRRSSTDPTAGLQKWPRLHALSLSLSLLFTFSSHVIFSPVPSFWPLD